MRIVNVWEMLDRKVLIEALCFVNMLFWQTRFIWTSSFRLLYSLAFNARFLRHLWYLISSMTTRMITGYVLSHFWNWVFVKTEYLVEREWNDSWYDGTLQNDWKQSCNVYLAPTSMTSEVLWFCKTKQNLRNWTVVKKLKVNKSWFKVRQIFCRSWSAY